MIRALLAAGLFLMPFPALAAQPGIGAWENSNYTMLSWIEEGSSFSWYYNWRPDQLWEKRRRSRTVEFVPMIHNPSDVNKKIVSDLPVSTLLGFNEPDAGASKGRGLPVEKAIALWPKLEARGLRLGSPATMQSGTLGKNSWQRRFMDQVEAKGLRVDFMAVHYYSTNGSVRDFEKWLRKVHAEYKRPIWVTEFAYIDWSRPQSVSYAQNATFAQAAIQMMERLPFVERHAWFAANPDVENGRHPKINLVDDKLRPTPIGTAYERAVSRITGRQASLRSEPR